MWNSGRFPSWRLNFQGRYRRVVCAPVALLKFNRATISSCAFRNRYFKEFCLLHMHINLDELHQTLLKVRKNASRIATIIMRHQERTGSRPLFPFRMVWRSSYDQGRSNTCLIHPELVLVWCNVHICLCKSCFSSFPIYPSRKPYSE